VGSVSNQQLAIFRNGQSQVGKCRVCGSSKDLFGALSHLDQTACGVRLPCSAYRRLESFSQNEMSYDAWSELDGDGSKKTSRPLQLIFYSLLFLGRWCHSMTTVLSLSLSFPSPNQLLDSFSIKVRAGLGLGNDIR
jgi:hypothetical protein